MRFITPTMAWSYDNESINSIDFNPNKNEIAVATTDKTPE